VVSETVWQLDRDTRLLTPCVIIAFNETTTQPGTASVGAQANPQRLPIIHTKLNWVTASMQTLMNLCNPRFA
jgi:hypothetical protein